jgi:uncharacterized membrane protein
MVENRGKKRRKKLIADRALRFAAIALVTVTLALSCTGCDVYNEDSPQLMEQLNIVVEPQKNGDVKMTETWHVNLKKRKLPYKNFYRTFKNDSAKADDITDLTVYDEDTQCQFEFIGDVDPENGSYKENTCYIHKTADTTELGWFMPAMTSGVRTFKISYTIKNLVSVYQDTAVLYQFLVPDQFSMPIASLTGTIRLPEGGKKDDLRVWMHSDASGRISIDSATEISFSAERIPENTYVDVRVCMPAALFSDSPRKQDYPILHSIQAQEEEWGRQHRRLAILDATLGSLAALFGVVVLFRCVRGNRRFRVDVPEYTREIPDDYSPAAVAELFYHYSGGVKGAALERVLSATVLDLAYRGYLVFSRTDNDYSIGIAPETSKKKRLKPCEKIFLGLMKDVAESTNGPFTMRQFRQYAKKERKNVYKTMCSFFSAANEELKGKEYFQSKKVNLTILMIFAALVLCAAVSTLMGAVAYVYLGIIVGTILCIIARSLNPRLTKKGEYQYQLWQGLKKYLLEFSRMKEYDVPQLALWEEYLVYATMMGISSQVCINLRLVYPQLNDNDYVTAHWSGTSMNFMFGSSDFLGGRSFGSALALTCGSISTAASRVGNPAAIGSKGFGGGAFSGGGGGFGGGGGGVR